MSSLHVHNMSTLIVVRFLPALCALLPPMVGIILDSRSDRRILCDIELGRSGPCVNPTCTLSSCIPQKPTLSNFRMAIVGPFTLEVSRLVRLDLPLLF
ncbi:hypothetical protein K503DRAFT_87506 [Rhizopogon vinicolor AM-OR11-026]|uniref:Uncharacterized protein n=1 Tax=Rhizopogon vinicolor AM-OR11-026 TaxID=1314800 RepID=A0A1B7NFG7_9AGAM|nr:hypothetical protein K503DRAFT_87506 [Rhizopogon vinicolor AM-OR11-026]